MNYFTRITTGIVFAFIIILFFNDKEGLSYATLAEIPLMGILTAFVTRLIHHNEVSGGRLAARIAVHYVLIGVIMSIFGVLFGWVKCDLWGIGSMLLATAGVYVFTFAVTYFTAKREADELNEALQRKRTK